MRRLLYPDLSRFLLIGLSLSSIIPSWSFIHAVKAAQAAPTPQQVLASQQVVTLASSASPMNAFQAVQQLALELVNRDRAAEGLSPMQVDTQLAQAAQHHAEDMLKRNYFSHYSPEGHTPTDRLTAVGGTGFPSENIVMRERSRFRHINIQALEEFQDQWMHSPKHRHSLMNPRLEKFGYGLAIDPASGRTFAVQLFSRR
jgi:uncharacterized protein YkwD